ncbi:unnamed protein product [Rhizophagus irregularis]|nr:unnamed protein product [Rhizophagus irregularis]
MKSCWDSDPKKRPSIKDIRITLGDWTYTNKNKAEFKQAEVKRKKSIESKKIRPEFVEKRHSGGNYTSRSLSALISKISSFYSLTISFNSSHISKLESYNTDIIKSLSSQNLNFAIQKFSTSLNSSYISEELEFDINTESLTSQDLNSTIRNYSTTLDSNYISAELEFDINTKSFLSQNLSCTNQNFSTSLKKRRNEELLNVENYDNSGKYLSGKRIKTSFNYLLK